MKTFGYTIQNDRQIDFDAADKKLYRYVAEKEPDINLCIFCGTCTATCSAAEFKNMSFRKISLFLRRGLTENLKREIESCMFCGKCTLVCPRGINTRNIIFNIRKGIEEYEF
ncbi:MAG: hypothetical protein A2W91_06255 [Bacteroidetes bacterium GWF2_38_335]|nr:MAG: hypothetical protein A2W91_06255 [Bacteroidetes bacterium GWF2_38_335]OFY79650.1 MAG: hypothetical protein A2281_09425 [Bacteroidetes bacterium RIFOXYA12_FULL_38_20]